MVQRSLAGSPPSPPARAAGARTAQFEALFTAHAGAVYAYARRRTTPDLADDVVAETFLVAWRRFDDLPQHLRPWLVGVARNVLANQLRGEARRAVLTGRLRHLAAITAPDSGAVPVGDLHVVAALKELPPSEREVIELIAWDGLSPTEVATALGIPRATVYVRIHRARRRLSRRLLEER